MEKSSFKFILKVIILILTCLFALAACSDSENADTEIISAEIKDGNVTVKATLEKSYAENHSGEKLYLIALSEIDPEGSLDGAVSIAESKAKGKMTFKFSLYDANGSTRVASAFVLAEKNGESYSAITDPYYISNPDAQASLDNKGNSPSGIKGFFTDDVYEARLVGAENVLFEARMDKLMLDDFKKDAVRFDLDGVSYYYDADEVEKLDRLIIDANSAGMKVYLRTVLRREITEGGDDSRDLSFLYCRKAEDAFGYLPDLSDERAVKYVKAFYAFLASRYDVSEFIIGERVNDYAKFCNAGRLTSDEFEAMYSFWVRTAYQMLRSVNSSASVTVPVDDAWRIDASSERIGAKVFLTRFADNARRGGDYGYSIALNLCEGDDLSSLLSKTDSDPSDVGVENLPDVIKFIESPDMRFESEKRSIIIDGLSLSTDKHKEKDCAAYYTAAYYTAAANGFDAFFCSSSPYLDGDSKKVFYYATVMCGTSLNSQLKEYIESIDKIAFPDLNKFASKKLTYIQSAASNIEESIAKNSHKLDIIVSDLTMCGGVYDIQGIAADGTDGGQASMLIRSDTANGIAAVTALNLPAEDIVSAGYIAVTMSSPDASHASVIISCNDRTFVGETAISNTQDTYYFDISGFSREADDSGSLTLSVCFLSDGEGEMEAELGEIRLCGASGNGFEATVTIIIVVLVLVLLAGLMVLLVVRRKKNAASNDSSNDE